MDESKLRLCRSLLFLPASNPRAVEKARELPADMIIFDLEDAVKEEDKGMAREAAVAHKELAGVDVYLDWSGGSANDLGAAVEKLSADGLKLTAIARDACPGPECLSIRRNRVPVFASHRARASPVGPAPTIRIGC